MALPTTRRNIPAGAVAVRIRNAIKDAQQDSLEEIAEQIIDQAILFMPTHDPVRDPDPTVNMAERIGYVIVGDEVRITVDTVYAAKQHEALWFDHPRGGGPKYLERALTEMIPLIRGIVADNVRARLVTDRGRNRTPL